MGIALAVSIVTCCIMALTLFVQHLKALGNRESLERMEANRDCAMAHNTKLVAELTKWQKRHRKIVKQLGYDPDSMNVE